VSKATQKDKFHRLCLMLQRIDSATDGMSKDTLANEFGVHVSAIGKLKLDAERIYGMTIESHGKRLVIKEWGALNRDWVLSVQED